MTTTSYTAADLDIARARLLRSEAALGTCCGDRRTMAAQKAAVSRAAQHFFTVQVAVESAARRAV